MSLNVNYTPGAGPTREDMLRRHLIRAEPFATAYQQRVMRLQTEYVPPYHPLVGGWDTRFMDKKSGQAYSPIALVWFTVNVMASLMGMRSPGFQVEPKTSDTQDREDAAHVELLAKYEVQRQSLKEVHLDLCKVLSLKGRAGVKIGYDGKDLWTENIDNIENLWSSFANDSFRRVMAYTYHSLIDRDSAIDMGWRDTGVSNQGGGFWQWASSKFTKETHDDPLGRWSRANFGQNPSSGNPLFDGLPMIDFHFKDKDGHVINQTWITGQQVDEKQLKVDEFPYITVNCEQEPGNPFGIGDAEPVTTLQREIAQIRTQWHEAIRRNGQDTWKVYNLKGLGPTDLEGGGRFFYLGDKESQDIEALKYPIDDVGYLQALNEAWEDYRRVTGIPPEVLGGGQISSGTSGYAMAVKFQSVITRLGPRERRLKTFYQRWFYLTMKNLEVVEPDAGRVIKSNYFTDVDFENITPKDFQQQVSALAVAVQGGFLSKRSAMEEIGKVSEDEEQYIREANSDPALEPMKYAQMIQAKGQAQAIASQGAQGQPPTAGTAAASADQNAGMPSMTGENQYTGSRPGAANPVMENPV